MEALLRDPEPAPQEHPMETDGKALTVSEYVWITDTIADVQIIAANAEAAALYGYDRPEDLIGRYLSQTSTQEDLMRGCLYSLARNRGIEVPTTYVTNILQPNGSTIPVLKEIFQIQSTRGLLFVAMIEKTEELSQKLPNLEELGLTSSDLVAWRGVMNIAEVEELMSDRLDVSGKKTLTWSSLQNIISALHNAEDKKKDESSVNAATSTIGPPITIGPGESRLLPNSRWLHRCGKCSHIWHSEQSSPAKCTRQRDDVIGVKCGTSLWRQTWPEFVENARKVAEGKKLSWGDE